MERNNEGGFRVSAVYIGLILAAIPLIVIVISFMLGGWSWGLMDDHRMVMIPGSICERLTNSFMGMFNYGLMRPVAAVHYAVFYKIFSHNPTAFYIFRWFECVMMLGVWAYLSFKVTRSRFAPPLFLCAALSFYKLYDAFFYLSTQEVFGLLFVGIAMLFFFGAIGERLENGGRFCWGSFTAGMGFLLLAFGSKEPFLAVGIALGLSMVLMSVRSRGKGVLVAGITTVVLGIIYAVGLKLFVMKEYSSAYAITDLGVMSANALVWVQKDLLSHLPWIVLGFILMFVRSSGSWTRVRLWALWMGVLSYAGYTVLLLPWNVWGYYAGPLGVFFAFIIAVGLADKVERLRRPQLIVLGGAGFVFALVVGLIALRFHSGYQYDSANLMKWMGTNALFEHETAQGAVVRGNAAEPCEAVVAQVNALYGKTYVPFIFTPNVREILADAQTRYYLWSPQGGNQDLARLRGMWTPMFTSRHWVLFRRMY